MLMMSKNLSVLWIILIFGCGMAEYDNNIYLELLKEYFPVNLFSIDNLCLAIRKSENIHGKCLDQLGIICKNHDLAITMLDATAKIPDSGILYAGRFYLGNYDECITINHVYDGVKVMGKYCAAGLIIPDPKDLSNFSQYYKMATCIPDACSAEDILSIGRFYYPKLPPIILDDYCSTAETGKEYSHMEIITMTLFAFICLLMVMSTVLELYMQKVGTKCELPLLLAFSIITNTKNIIKTSKNKADQIYIFNGMKSISMMWIVLAHGFSLWITTDTGGNGLIIPVLNHQDFIDFHYKRISSYVDGAHLAVDTFFFMSGFLLAFHYLKSNEKPVIQQIKSLPYFYLHRILRLTPALYMLYVFGMWIFPKIGQGPIWDAAISFVQTSCINNWWSYFLLVQNYVNYDDMCLIPTWYLSAEFQMFLVSPLVLIPLSRVLRRPGGYNCAMKGLILFCLVWIVGPIAIRLYCPEYKNAFDTHSRYIDYIMGMIMAVFIRERNDSSFLQGIDKRHHSVLNLLLWTIMLFGMSVCAVLYQDAEVYQTETTRAFYYSLSRSFWCLALCWIIYSCHHGYGGIANWIMCRPIFQVVAKLTYSMYLLHYLVIAYDILQNKGPRYFSNYSQYSLWCSYMVSTFFVSYLWTLAFESPVITIEKYLFGNTRKPTIAAEPKTGTTESGSQTVLVD